jgi:hypothetical protein
MGLVSLPLGSSSQKAYEGMTAAPAIDAETASRFLLSQGMRHQEGHKNETAARWYPFRGWRRVRSRHPMLDLSGSTDHYLPMTLPL